MTNLIQRLFGEGKKPKSTDVLSPDEIKPFFEALGMDIEALGFPEIPLMSSGSMDEYTRFFSNVRLKLRRLYDRSDLDFVIKGVYEVQPCLGYRDEDNLWRPGGLTRYSFKIKEGKLNLKRK